MDFHVKWLHNANRSECVCPKHEFLISADFVQLMIPEQWLTLGQNRQPVEELFLLEIFWKRDCCCLAQVVELDKFRIDSKVFRVFEAFCCSSKHESSCDRFYRVHQSAALELFELSLPGPLWARSGKVHRQLSIGDQWQMTKSKLCFETRKGYKVFFSYRKMFTITLLHLSNALILSIGIGIGKSPTAWWVRRFERAYVAGFVFLLYRSPGCARGQPFPCKW